MVVKDVGRKKLKVLCVEKLYYQQGIRNIYSGFDKGKYSARKLKRVRILLLLSEGDVADEAGARVFTVYKIWNRYFEEGKHVKKTVEERPHSGQPPKPTATVKAHVTAITCSSPPKGSSQGTLKMISKKVVKLGYGKKISTEAVRK